MLSLNYLLCLHSLRTERKYFFKQWKNLGVGNPIFSMNFIFIFFNWPCLSYLHCFSCTSISGIWRDYLIFFSLLNGLVETAEIDVGRHLVFVVENILLGFRLFGTVWRSVGCFCQSLIWTVGSCEWDCVTLRAIQPRIPVDTEGTVQVASQCAAGAQIGQFKIEISEK